MDAVERLFINAIDPKAIRPDPISPGLTIPRTWGVYKILDEKCGPSGKRFRNGNHPIREIELEREFSVEVVALMPSKALAVDLAGRLNARKP